MVPTFRIWLPNKLFRNSDLFFLQVRTFLNVIVRWKEHMILKILMLQDLSQ